MYAAYDDDDKVLRTQEKSFKSIQITSYPYHRTAGVVHLHWMAQSVLLIASLLVHCSTS